MTNRFSRSSHADRVVLASVIVATAVSALVAAVLLVVTDGPGDRVSAVGRGESTGAAKEKPLRLTPWSLPYAGGHWTIASDSLRGTLFTGTTVVRALADELVAMDVATGRRLWESRLPATLCQASTIADGGVGVIAYGSEEDCGTVAGVDLRTGRLMWTRPLTIDESAINGAEPQLARSGDTVVAAMKHHPTTAFRVSDGAQLWTEKAALYGGGACYTDSYTGGLRLVRLASCVANGFHGHVVEQVDPGTGRAQWTFRLRRPGLLKGVLSTDPIMVDDEDRSDKAHLVVLSDQGTVRSTLADGLEHSGHQRADGNPSGNVLISGDTVAVALEPKDAATTEQNTIVAWSITSGKRLWGIRGSTDTMRLHPVPSTGGGLLAYAVGRVNERPQLVRIDPASGQQSVVRQYDPADAWAGAEPVPALYRGALFLTCGILGAGGPTPTDHALVALPGL
ncbi:outer membrane protein assembly factor BamB family protein [Actinomadura montaniterrae]|uniref:PQQ-binding-like beta-propeller repeat protein n=1 Tax=Actinomadura montaniterrae TaxID=1803903 RepID=A0A6L3W6B1_9ACTN|nr:PQQ-binding-like beta-propeller repeat protein [Actinomadura montaniterrae]KAB2385925.1 PQQ-binding-like beta-propeller repeat protein [Actinomadura montaniterrae]